LSLRRDGGLGKIKAARAGVCDYIDIETDELRKTQSEAPHEHAPGRDHSGDSVPAELHDLFRRGDEGRRSHRSGRRCRQYPAGDRAEWAEDQGDLDHAGGAKELKEALGVDIIGPHEDDLPLLQRIETQAEKYGLPSGQMQNVEPDRWLKDGDTVSFGEHVFEVYHTPGHAPGHVIYFNRAQKFAHLGDVLFNGSIGRTDLPGGNHQQLLDSIRDKVLPLGDEVGFICGHGPGSRIGDERRGNPYLQGL